MNESERARAALEAHYPCRRCKRGGAEGMCSEARGLYGAFLSTLKPNPNCEEYMKRRAARLISEGQP